MDIQKFQEQLAATITSSIDRWLENNKKEDIQQNLYDQLNREQEQIIGNLLGFSKSWSANNWEVDHCNGRAGESAVGDYLRQVAATEINSWFKSIQLKKPTKAFQAAITREYTDLFQKKVEAKLDDLADQQADIFIDGYIKKLSLTELDALLKSHTNLRQLLTNR